MELSNSAVKTPDAEQSAKPPPAAAPSNGVLKRHAPLLHHHHAVVVTYKECLKNHAASLGGHAVDGCGEFMPSPASNPADPTSLRCAACGCHRNFHRREPDEAAAAAIAPPPPPALEYRPHHRHHPPPPGSPDDSPSPPPISSSYYPSAPHMLLALSHSHSHPDGGALISPNASSGSRKRFRTKFTQNQKELMLDFAEKIGWKMQKKDEDSINRFCSDAGLERGVLKVWMHNNKNSLAKKPTPANNGGGGGISYAAVASAAAAAAEEDSDSKESVQLQHDNNGILGTNGSSSS